MWCDGECGVMVSVVDGECGVMVLVTFTRSTLSRKTISAATLKVSVAATV